MHILPLPLEDISPVPLLNILNLFIPDLEIFKLEEYDFDHIFHKISPSSDPKHLAKIYITCIENLLINEKDFNAGINLILTKDWLFIAPIYNSIGTANEKEVYLNPLAYAGIFHLPYFDKYWPETAGVFKVPRNPYTLLKRTSTFEPIEKDI